MDTTKRQSRRACLLHTLFFRGLKEAIKEKQSVHHLLNAAFRFLISHWEFDLCPCPWPSPVCEQQPLPQKVAFSQLRSVVGQLRRFVKAHFVFLIMVSVISSHLAHIHTSSQLNNLPPLSSSIKSLLCNAVRLH